MLGNPNTPQGERSLEDTETEGRGEHCSWKGMGTKGILSTGLGQAASVRLPDLVAWKSAQHGPAVTGESLH